MALRSYSIWFLMLVLGLGGVASAQSAYLGFDRNLYPGDAALPTLNKTFRYMSYWLNTPPGTNINTWTGKRAILGQYGFGFLVLFNGRGETALGRNPAALGAVDGKAAAAAAEREGFEPGVLIFLDQEEGGRLTPPQASYLFAWIDGVRAAGYRAGVYCSGIEVTDESGPISTAQDIAQREAERAKIKGGPAQRLALWIANDKCPPSPGCTVKQPALSAGVPKLPGVETPVWQYAQSPRRKMFSAACPQNAAPDGNCYAPGLPAGPGSFIDLNVADSPDPSRGR